MPEKKQTDNNQGLFFGVGIIMIVAALADRFLGLYILSDLLRVLVLVCGAGMIFLAHRAKKQPPKQKADHNHTT